jgi:hypothetical protein
MSQGNDRIFMNDELVTSLTEHMFYIYNPAPRMYFCWGQGCSEKQKSLQATKP